MYGRAALAETIVRKLRLNSALLALAVSAIAGCGAGSNPSTTAVPPNASLHLSAASNSLRIGESTSINVVGTQIDTSQIAWSLACPGNSSAACGSINGAVFSSPSTVPSGGAVVITATAPVSGQATITASLTLNLLNPAPVLRTVSPSAVTPGPVTLTVSGSGFTPQSSIVVAANPTASVQTSLSYVSATQMNVSLVTPSAYSGTLVLSVSNPDPGASSSTVAAVSVATPSTLSLTTGSSQLRMGKTTSVALTGEQVDVSKATFSLACQAAAQSDCGTLISGVYTAPSVLPMGGAAVSVIAKAPSTTGTMLSASSVLQILNPVPVLVTIKPGILQAGASTVTLTGSGFTGQSAVAVTTSSASQIQSSSTFIDPTHLAVQVTTADNFNGQLTFQVTNPDPGSALSGTASVQVTADITYDAAVRFLRQATYGPTPSLIAHVQDVGFSQFLEEQFAASPSLYNPTQWWQQERFSLMRNAVIGNDQLRQRVSQALSETIVTSMFGQSADQSAFPVWMNTLQSDAFGTYGQVLTDTLKLPALAAFLTNIGNNATSDPSQHVSQNLGRELLQLFSVGPYLLNQDGSLIVDRQGNPMPTYDNDVIDGVSRALTGWNFQLCANSSTCMWQTALVGIDQKHDTQSKQLLSGTVPAGGSSTQDLDALVSNIMQHPNVAPFISRRLIQALVTSNPSPQYIARVALVFRNDGTGTTGNLKAVVKTILLDPEARGADDTSVAAPGGHIQEPILFAAAAVRAVGTSIQPYLSSAPVGEDSPGPWAAGDAVDIETWAGAMGEQPLYSPSVFNFFSWQNTLSGTSTFAPEMQIQTSSTVIARANFVNDLLYGYLSQDAQNMGWLVASASSSSTLVTQLNHYLLAGRMDASSCSAIAAAVDVIPSSDPNARVRQALYLFLTSPQYQVIQ